MTDTPPPPPATVANRKPALRLIVGLWSVGFLAMTASGLASGIDTPLAGMVHALAMTGIGMVFSFALWRWLVEPGGSPTTMLARLAPGIVAAVSVHVCLDLGLDGLFERVLGAEPLTRRIISDSLLRFWAMRLVAETHVLLYVGLYAFFGMAATALRSAAETAARDNLLAQARAAAATAQLSALRHQLNPHFVFNTLNAVGSLVSTGRTAQAEAMIDRLSDFLRASLGADATPFVPLAEELSTIEAYLEIEQIRFADRMRVEYDIPAELRPMTIPHFLLQPLVENAIKYALGLSVDPVTIRLSARRDGADLLLTVEDDGRPAGPERPPVAGTGTGLRNVRERLALVYGDRALLQTQRKADGFAASVRLPIADRAEAAAA
jgi:signal transduction histidine kinase